MSDTLRASFEYVNRGLGHLLEFGVHTGGTVRLIRNAFPELYEVYGFDTFTGLPHWWGGTARGPGFFDMQGEVPEIEGVTIYKGRFCDTIREYRKDARPIALLHVDSDTYCSAVEVLCNLDEYIVTDTVIVFDEWVYKHDARNVDGERKACLEWAHFCHRKLRYLPTPGWDIPNTEQRALVVENDPRRV